MLVAYVQQNGATRRVERIDPAWVEPAATETLWIDLVQPTKAEGRQILAELLRLHPLAVEDALAAIHDPKVESYGAYLYLILHGIAFEEREHRFATRDVDFFLGRNYLVTVHDGRSRSISGIMAACDAHAHVLAEGPAALLHRIVDAMIDNYRPEIERFEALVDEFEDQVVGGAREGLMQPILALRRDLASLRRVLVPQRDAVGRLARREFPQISDEMAFRFRDVHDHLVRLADDTMLFRERVSGIFEGHLMMVSNQLNRIMKVLTVMSTVFLPLTVVTGMWGMNVALPVLPGGEPLQFWWVAGMMVAISALMLAVFLRKRWL